ncbi:hypothetical protein [Ideonella sp. YS5]|uniref:hypothetical protein n=1 Tax=Ideonella sp. YS5 TaxID=3453714 RepID=UPI003EED2350
MTISRRLRLPSSLVGLLVAAAVLPAVALFAVTGWMHAGEESRLRQDLQQRAALIASALAEASEYGLISGNAAALDRSVRELLRHDSAIAAIDILDASRKPFVSLPGTPLASGLPSAELPVRSSVPDIDFFDSPTPHVSMPEEVQPTFRLGPVAGYVRVTMSPDALVAAARQAFVLQLAIIAVASLAGVLGVVVLARRLRASLLVLREGLRGLIEGRYEPLDGPMIGAELKRVRGALAELAETLAARNSTLGGMPTGAPATGAPPGPGSPPGLPPSLPASVPRMPLAAPDALQQDRMARRIVGRFDAALSAVRLCARHASRLAEAAGDDDERGRAHRTALHLMALAEQLDTVGANLTEPMRHRIVDGSGSLEAALDELMAESARAHPGCRLSVQRDEGFGVAAGTRAVHLHRAMQEALSYLVSCSDASEAAVHLQRPNGSGELQVRITDNGRGEESDAARERLAQIHDGLVTCGGRAELARLPGGGSCLTLSVPAMH